jgi:ATP-binding protein involved in chromosome partitioning
MAEKFAGCGVDQGKNEEEIRLNENMARIKHKIIVMSGKGGVGKSTVSVNLTYGLLFQGKSTGLLDVDIHGPSVAKMLGIKEQPLRALNGMIKPVEVTSSLKVMSMGTLIDDPDTPIIWRGPLKIGAIKQFLGEVDWGELDYLVIDSPPGTGDEPLTIAQLIPDIDGAVIVTTPQEVALLDSRKSITFAKKLNIPILGIIENMSGFVCPHCGERTDLFKVGGGQKAAEDMGVPFLGRIPIEPDIVSSGDEGTPYIMAYGKTETAKVIEEIVSKITQEVE